MIEIKKVFNWARRKQTRTAFFNRNQESFQLSEEETNKVMNLFPLFALFFI